MAAIKLAIKRLKSGSNIITPAENGDHNDIRGVENPACDILDGFESELFDLVEKIEPARRKLKKSTTHRQFILPEVNSIHIELNFQGNCMPRRYRKWIQSFLVIFS